MRELSCGDSVGISGLGYFIPEGVLTSGDLSRLSGIPEAVFLEKIGIEQKHIAGPDLHPAEMGARAARIAIGKAGIDPLLFQLTQISLHTGQSCDINHL